jgi:Xaa-Pro dipeptidase
VPVMMDKTRARRIMDRHELDALIGTARENIAYVSGLEGVDRRGSNRLERMFVVFPRDPDKDTILVIPRAYLLQVLQNGLTDASIRSVGTYYYVLAEPSALSDEERELVALREQVPEYASPTEGLVAALADLDLGEQPSIGIDESHMFYGEWMHLSKVFPKARLSEAYRVFQEIRMVKSPAEVERLRRVAQINEHAMLDAIELIREGVEQRVVQHKLRQGLVGAGATISHDAIGFAWRSNYSHVEPSDYHARVGDVFKFDYGSFFDGYASDIARSGVIGKPSPQLASRYAAVRDAQQLGIETVRPGMTARELFNVMIESLRKDLKDSGFQRHNLGHGIGRDVYDPPNINSTDDTVLEAGMVLNIETPVHELGFGGLNLEDTLLLKDDGVEYLTHANRDLIVR